MGAQSDLARVSPEAAFVDWLDVGGRPCVVVDGPALPGAVLALSHWPDAPTPPDLAADTSAQIVARYLDCAPAGPDVDVVTNNHYDEDGVLGIWLLLERPAPGDPRRSLAIAAAEAGDFHTWTDPTAVMVALALMAMAERASTPLPGVMRALSDPSGRDPAGAITAAVLGRTGDLLADPHRRRRLWQPRWERITEDIALIDAGQVAISEHAEADLAVVRAPRALDPFALYPRLSAMRVLETTPDGGAALTYRYETWVRYASRQLAPRVDLARLARRLDALDDGPGRWAFDGVGAMTPRLAPLAPTGGRAPTGISSERLEEEIARFLSEAGREVG